MEIPKEDYEKALQRLIDKGLIRCIILNGINCYEPTSLGLQIYKEMKELENAIIN